MKKRIRKKKHIGEFRQYGVQVVIVFHNQDGESSWKFIEFLEQIGLDFGGGGNGKRDMGFISKHRGSVTSEDTYKVADWLKNSSLVKSYAISSLIDAWHDRENKLDRIYDELETIVGIK